MTVEIVNAHVWGHTASIEIEHVNNRSGYRVPEYYTASCSCGWSAGRAKSRFWSVDRINDHIRPHLVEMAKQASFEGTVKIRLLDKSLSHFPPGLEDWMANAKTRVSIREAEGRLYKARTKGVSDKIIARLEKELELLRA